MEKKRSQVKKKNNQNRECFPKIFFRLRVHRKCLGRINTHIDCSNEGKLVRHNRLLARNENQIAIFSELKFKIHLMFMDL